MADNVTADAGSGGAVFATDDVGGVHYPVGKIAFGALDAAVLAIAGAGNATTGTQRVVIASDQAVISTNWAGTSPPIGAGTEAAALRVTLATDSTGLVSVDDNGGSLTVDSADLATLAGAVTGTEMQVDVITMPTTTVDWAGTAPPIGAGVEATALRVTLATDSTGVVSVDDNGGSLTVDSANLVTLAGAVSGSEMQVDVVAALPAGTNAIGKLAANTGVDIGDVDVLSVAGTVVVGGVAAHDSAVSGNPLLNGAEARTTTPTAVADGDTVRLQADDQGRLVTVLNAPRDLVVVGRLALTTTTRTALIAAGAAGVFHDLTLLVLSNESATEVRVDIFDLTTGGTAIFSVDLAADGGGAVISLPVPHPQATAANAWDAELSTAVSTVYITGQAVLRL